MKQLLIKLAVNWIPEILEFLAKRADKKGKLGKYGTAAKELQDVINEIEKSAKDGVIDEDELKKIVGETFELSSAISVLFGKEIKIKLKK